MGRTAEPDGGHGCGCVKFFPKGRAADWPYGTMGKKKAEHAARLCGVDNGVRTHGLQGHNLAL